MKLNESEDLVFNILKSREKKKDQLESVIMTNYGENLIGVKRQNKMQGNK